MDIGLRQRRHRSRAPSPALLQLFDSAQRAPQRRHMARDHGYWPQPPAHAARPSTVSLCRRADGRHVLRVERPDVVDDRKPGGVVQPRSEEHTSELQSRLHLVCRLLLEKKKLSKRVNLLSHTGSLVETYRT